MEIPNLPLTVKIIYEPEAKSAPYVAYTPELDVGSQGVTPKEAKENLRDAVEGFLEAAADIGTLDEVLVSAGLALKNGKLVRQKFPKFDKIKIPLSHIYAIYDLAHAPSYAHSLQEVD